MILILSKNEHFGRKFYVFGVNRWNKEKSIIDTITSGVLSGLLDSVFHFFVKYFTQILLKKKKYFIQKSFFL